MISVLLATADRPEMAQAMVQSLIATTDGHDIELCAAVDGDRATADYLISLIGSGAYKLAMTYQRPYRGASRAWNDALAMAKGDVVVLAADDLIFEPGWLDAALGALAALPDGWGLVGFNDGHWGPELSTHYLMSRRFVVEVLGGVVAWECYPHSFNDVETNERARRAERYIWCQGARVAHNHWLFGDRGKDETDARALPGHSDAAAAYARREAAGFPNDYKAVIS